MVLHDETWLMRDLLLYVLLIMEKAGDWKKGRYWKPSRVTEKQHHSEKISTHFPLKTLDIFFIGSMWWCHILFFYSFLFQKLQDVFPAGLVNSALWRREANTDHEGCALVAISNFFDALKDKGTQFSFEHSKVVTGKAWGFSVFLFFYSFLFFKLCTNQGLLLLASFFPPLPISPPTLHLADWMLFCGSVSSEFLVI